MRPRLFLLRPHNFTLPNGILIDSVLVWQTEEGEFEIMNPGWISVREALLHPYRVVMQPETGPAGTRPESFLTMSQAMLRLIMHGMNPKLPTHATSRGRSIRQEWPVALRQTRAAEREDPKKLIPGTFEIVYDSEREE